MDVLTDVRWYDVGRYKHDLVVKIREGKEKPEWLREDLWMELSEHIEQDDVKVKSKFMSDIAGGRPAADGPAPSTAVTVGVELVSIQIFTLPDFVNLMKCITCMRSC
jgi:hypothetical protein